MKYGSLLALVVLMSLQSGCGKNTDDSTSDPSYSDSAMMSQQYAISGFEAGADSSEGVPPTSGISTNGHLTALFAHPRPFTTCPTAFPACSAGVSTIDFGSCTDSDSSGDAITIAGTLSATFTVTAGGAADNTGCTSVTQSHTVLPDGDTVGLSQDMTATISAFPSFPAFAGLTMKRNFTSGPAWDGHSFSQSSAGYVVARSGTSRTLSADGVHNQVVSPHGVTWVDFDSSINMTVTGTLAGGNRSVTSGGTVTTWHNLLKYKVVHTAGNDGGGHPITWTDPTCCHPTEGQLTSVYTGSITGTSTLTFTNSQCGAVTFTDVNGATTSTTLDPCS